MANVHGYGPNRARELVTDNGALLVCAYKDQEKCERIRLEDSLTLDEFRFRQTDLSRDRAIIFY